MIGVSKISFCYNISNILRELHDKGLIQSQLMFFLLILLLGVASTQLRCNRITGRKSVDGKDNKNYSQHYRNHPEKTTYNKPCHIFAFPFLEFGYSASIFCRVSEKTPYCSAIIICFRSIVLAFRPVTLEIFPWYRFAACE